MVTISLSAQTEVGTFHISFSNTFSPLNENDFFLNDQVMSFGNEWVTGITIDGDDDDDNGNYYWDNDRKNKSSRFSLGGQFGYFITNGLLTGVGIEYGSFSNMLYYENDSDGDGYDDEETFEQNISSLAFSPFVKYYVSLGQNALFISSSYIFGTMNSSTKSETDYSSQQDEVYDDEDEPFKTSRFEFGTGMAFFLTENISLEPSVNYALNTYTQEREVNIGDTGPPNYTLIYDDQVRKVSTNAFYLKIAASMYF
tara:strand:+ start:182 stop:946 length:765 start_codon:yes stop_codon:yes gene_type:complete